MSKVILSTMLFCFLSNGSMALASDYPERTVSPFEAEDMENKDKDHHKAKKEERAHKDSDRVHRDREKNKHKKLTDSKRHKVHEQENIKSGSRVFIQRPGSHIVYPVDETNYPLGQGRPPQW